MNNTIIDKFSVVTEVLELASQHIPEGRYLEAMTALCDIYNHNNLNENAPLILRPQEVIEHNENVNMSVICKFREVIYQQLNSLIGTWWNRRSTLTNGKILTDLFCGMIYGIIAGKIITLVIKK